MHPLQEKLQAYTVVLASQSPRRAELLKGLDIDFEIRIKDVDESYPLHFAPEEVPEYLARKKFAEFEPEIDSDVFLITADTIVILDGVIIQKPQDAHEARTFLFQLSGKTHVVITGVCIGVKGRYTSFSTQSSVSFAELTEQEIAYYVDAYNPLDKAGAYGVQEWIGYVGISSISGSYFSVMGLPVHALYSHIMKFLCS